MEQDYDGNWVTSFTVGIEHVCYKSRSLTINVLPRPGFFFFFFRVEIMGFYYTQIHTDNLFFFWSK